MHYDKFAHTRDKRVSLRAKDGDNRGRPIQSIRNLKRRMNTYIAPPVEEPVEEAAETEATETKGVEMRDLGWINGEYRLFTDASSKVVGGAMVSTFQEAYAQALTGEVTQ